MMGFLRPQRILFLLFAILFLFAFEIFPRPGWVDSGMYTGYALNPSLYRIYALQGHSYQGSRLGFILPLELLTKIFGPVNGREAYVAVLGCAYFFAVTTLTNFLVRNRGERLLLIALFVLNPTFFSAIAYGGADGPAAVQLLMSACFLVLAAKSDSLLRSRWMVFACGVFAVCSLSSHVFAVVPALLLLPLLVVVLGLTGFWPYVVLGLITGTAFFTGAGFILGLSKFYLAFSMPWASRSLQGAGNYFNQPFAYWLQNAILWVPILGVIFLEIACLTTNTRRTEKRMPLIGATMNLIGPLTLFAAFDLLFGGNLFATPSYFNIVYPSFVLGLILLMHATDFGPERGLSNGTGAAVNRRSVALVGIIFISVLVAISSPHVRSVFLSNDIQSKAHYQSQVEFERKMRQLGLDNAGLQLVFTAARRGLAPTDRVYKDFFMGAPRSFDYIDSLAALYLWDRATVLRIDPNAATPTVTTETGDGPLVFLGRDHEEVASMATAFLLSKTGYHAGQEQCFKTSSYPWCFVEYKK